ncbi:glycosyltransferase family 8 protein [Favolaschia claudopus]|uniref:Glycosyltransferase family 8 protein n=1 Tax=Favolaschia claudopus TaxID=2862362 RepID=A0AAW0CLU4_9AGAR
MYTGNYQLKKLRPDFPMSSSYLSRISGRWSYERLPTSYGDRPPPRARCSQQARILIALVLVMSTSAIAWVWGVRYLRSGSYSPLDNYQNLNSLPVTTDPTTPPSPRSRRAVVSSLYSDDFAIAVGVLGYSARSANTTARLLLPYLSDRVSSKALCIVRAAGWEPYAVPLIHPPHDGQGIHRRFRDQYTKLNIWALDKTMGGIDSAVYLDADTLVRHNFDELFDSPFGFAAVPDVYGAGDTRGFSITFNAGVLAFRPSSAVLADMLKKMEVAQYPLKQAEQAFLNLYFGGTALRLPYIYNANLAIKTRSPALWDRLAPEMRIVHYTMTKPFILDGRNKGPSILSPEEIEMAMQQSERRDGGFYQEEVGWWRAAYRRMMGDIGQVIRECYEL